MGMFHTKFIAEMYANAIRGQSTRMGDSYTISGYPVGNGIVFTIVGGYPFVEDAGTSPMNDLVVIDDPDVAAAYADHFDYIWNLTK